jgi:uncharacterized membrane protein
LFIHVAIVNLFQYIYMQQSEITARDDAQVFFSAVVAFIFLLAVGITCIILSYQPKQPWQTDKDKGENRMYGISSLVLAALSAITAGVVYYISKKKNKSIHFHIRYQNLFHNKCLGIGFFNSDQ